MDRPPVLVVAPDDVLVEVTLRREAEDRLGQRVVHQRVEPVARQPLGRLVPDLADDVRLGVHGPAAPPELVPERLVADLGRHVQAPAVDPEAEPVLGDLEEVLADLRVVGVELGQGGQPPPRPVAQAAHRLVAARRRRARRARARPGRRRDPSATGRDGTGGDPRAPPASSGTSRGTATARRSRGRGGTPRSPRPGVVEHAVEHHPDARAHGPRRAARAAPRRRRGAGRPGGSRTCGSGGSTPTRRSGVR